MSLQQFLIKNRSNFLFKVFGESFYFLSTCILKSVYALFGIKATIRNSYFYNYYILFKSDIDYTLQVASTKNTKYVSKIHYFLKFLIPPLGEYNLYDDSKLETARSIGNYYELARDPIFKRSNKKASLSDAIVFYLRQAYADKLNQSESFILRSKKWKHHTEKINSSLDLNLKIPNSFTDIFENLLQLARETQLNVKSDFAASIKIFFTNDHLSIDRDPKSSSIFFIFLWHDFCDYNRPVEYMLSQLKNPSPLMIEIFLSNIEWEILGLTTQIDNLKDDDFSFHSHLPFLYFCLCRIKIYNYQEIRRINMKLRIEKLLQEKEVDLESFQDPEKFWKFRHSPSSNNFDHSSSI